MRNILKALGIMAIVMLSWTPAHAGFSLSIGTNNSYLSVGDYDYLPYASQGYGTPRISFYDAMGDYGNWVYEAPFGRVWHPYASNGWRPYTQGHWVYTSYGPTWVGYEPWAWAAYHYGNWIYTRSNGWVWIPGYDWHPGRVMWSRSNDSIGWSPAPPTGYDYSRGYLNYRGSYNQYTYGDNDIYNDYNGGYDNGYGQNNGYNNGYDNNGYDNNGYGNNGYGNNGYGNNGYGYNNGYGNNNGYGQNFDGGPYYDPRYRDLYYNSGYQQIVPQIWIFIQIGNFNRDNYNDCYYGGSYARQIYDNHMMRFSSRPLPRVFVERNTHQSVREVGVRVKELQANDHRIKMVIPDGEEDQVRRHANETVKQVIAPAFIEKGKQFKGTNSKVQSDLARAFKQDERHPQIEKVSSDQLLRESKQVSQDMERRRGENERKQIETMVRIKKEADIRTADRTKENQQRNDRGNNDQNQKVDRNTQFDRNPKDNSQFDRNPKDNSQFDRKNSNSDNNLDQRNADVQRQKQQDKAQQDRVDQERRQQQQLQQDRTNQEQKRLQQSQQDQQSKRDQQMQQDRIDQERRQQQQLQQDQQSKRDQQMQQDRIDQGQRQQELDQRRMQDSQRYQQQQQDQQQQQEQKRREDLYRQDQSRDKNTNDQPQQDRYIERNRQPVPEPQVQPDSGRNRDAGRVQQEKQQDTRKDNSDKKNRKDKKQDNNDNPPPHRHS